MKLSAFHVYLALRFERIPPSSSVLIHYIMCCSVPGEVILKTDAADDAVVV